MRIKILDHEAILQKTTRIAYQIIEENYEEKELVLIGIRPNGSTYCEWLQKAIQASSKVKITILNISLNKLQPLSEEIVFEKGKTSLKNKVVILVDDVASTGKTAFYALKPIMDEQPKKVQIAVLVDRKHKQFPVSADFVGTSLSTTLQEHILVNFSAKKSEAFLL
jgi:pyrimidine operon attenuation protein/uracil phosphoribosyltransferase